MVAEQCAGPVGFDIEVIVAVLLPPFVVADQCLHAVSPVVVDDFVCDDECQLGFVVQLGDKSCVDEYHALRGGEGIDARRGDGVETEFGTQAGVVFEQGVGYARGEGADGVAVDDVATGQHAVDMVGGLEDLLLVAHTLASVLFGTLDVAVVELPHAHLQVGGHGSRAAQCLPVEGGGKCEADE